MSLTENAIFKAKQIAGLVTRKTGKAVTISKLKLQVVQQNALIQSTYERIGSLVYEQEQTSTNNLEIISVCVSEVDIILSQINDINEKISLLKDGSICTACSVSNPVDTVYCQNCGSKLSEQFSSKI